MLAAQRSGACVMALCPGNNAAGEQPTQCSDYFFFASSFSSRRKSSIARLGSKSSSSNNWRSSISPSFSALKGAGQRLAQSVEGPFAEPRELIAGYWLIQVESKEEAVGYQRRVIGVPEGANVEPCQPGCQAWLWSAKAGKWAEQPKDAPV
jgi:hypothetical protein